MSDWISVEDCLPIQNSEIDTFYTCDVIGANETDVFPCEFSAGTMPYFWHKFSVDGVTDWMHLPAHKSAEAPWTDWHGGECPVEPRTLVDVQFRNGEVFCGEPALSRDVAYRWTHIGNVVDIVKYRLHKDEDK